GGIASWRSSPGWRSSLRQKSPIRPECSVWPCPHSACPCLFSPRECCACSGRQLALFVHSGQTRPMSGYSVTFPVANPLQGRGKLTHCCRGAETQSECCQPENIKPVQIISAQARPQKDSDRRIAEIGEVGIRVDLNECRVLRGVGSPAPLGRGIVRRG